MKVRKKRKEAEREGEASSVTVSQRVLPAPSPLEGAFLGQEDLPLLTQLEKRERGDRESERQQRGFGVCPFCSLTDCEMLSALFTHHWRDR